MMLDQLVKDAYQLFGSGNVAEAERLCRQVLDQDPGRAEAVYLLAAVDHVRGQTQAAAENFERAARLAPDNAVFVNAWGESLHDAGRLDEAFTCYQNAIQLRPTYERSHCNIGRILHQRGDLAGAERSFIEAIRLSPTYAVARNNLGSIFLARGEAAAAIEQLRQALQLQPNYPEAHYNLAASLRLAGHATDAVLHLREAIRLRPNYGRAHLLMGRMLSDHAQVASSVPFFEAAVRLLPDDPQGYFELGSVQMLLERYVEAQAAFTKSLALNPSDRRSFARLCRLKSVMLDWRDQSADNEKLWNDVAAEIQAGRPTPIPPLFSFAMPWSGAQHLTVARSHSSYFERVPIGRSPQTVAAALPQKGVRPLATMDDSDITHNGEGVRPRFEAKSVAAPNRSGRIKIAYLSRDFYDHAVGHQMQGVFALHDRTKFEVHAYSFGPDDGSIYRRRIARDVEFFHDVTPLRDRELADQIRADGIEILVDLMGYTGFARTECLAMKPAPVQVSWLGYPGTMGARFIDYLIGDHIVTPAKHADDFSECLVRLPNSYMPTDRQQPIADDQQSRAEHGLPAGAVVFCCFHNTYKITPEIFQVWMRILDQVAGSVVWFNARHPLAQENLRREARNSGIDPDRLIFATHVADKAAHLSRLRLADLFLDAPYYNAHVTACDSLWSGLPVLTCPGQTFASRVGASLLAAANMPELIASNIEEYEQRAVELGNDRHALALVRDRLNTDRLSLPLFDTRRFVRNLERAMTKMWEIHESGKPPRPIDVVE